MVFHLLIVVAMMVIEQNIIQMEYVNGLKKLLVQARRVSLQLNQTT